MKKGDYHPLMDTQTWADQLPLSGLMRIVNGVVEATPEGREQPDRPPQRGHHGAQSAESNASSGNLAESDLKSVVTACLENLAQTNEDRAPGAQSVETYDVDGDWVLCRHGLVQGTQNTPLSSNDADCGSDLTRSVASSTELVGYPNPMDHLLTLTNPFASAGVNYSVVAPDDHFLWSSPRDHALCKLSRASIPRTQSLPASMFSGKYPKELDIEGETLVRSVPALGKPTWIGEAS